MTTQQPADAARCSSRGRWETPIVIKRSILRLLVANGLGLLAVLMLYSSSSNPVAIGMFVVAFIWGTIELFILSALLLAYGLTGLAQRA